MGVLETSIIVILVSLFEAHGLSFTSTNSISGDDTFLCNAEARLDCSTTQSSTVILKINNTDSAICYPNACLVNTNLTGNFNIKTNTSGRQITVHTDAVSASFASTTFTCEADGTSRTIQPVSKVFAKNESTSLIITENDRGTEVKVTTGCTRTSHNITVHWYKTTTKAGTVLEPLLDVDVEKLVVSDNTNCIASLNCEGNGISGILKFKPTADGKPYYILCVVRVTDGGSTGNVVKITNRTFTLRDNTMTFNLVGSVDGNSTFACNTNATITCLSHQTPFNMTVSVNGTTAAKCNDHVCFTNPEINTKFKMTPNYTSRQLALHIDSVTEDLASVVFRCQVNAETRTLQPVVKVFPNNETTKMEITAGDNGTEIKITTSCLRVNGVSFTWYKQAEDGTTVGTLSQSDFEQFDIRENTEDNSNCEPGQNCGGTGASSAIRFQEASDGEKYLIYCLVKVSDSVAAGHVVKMSNRTFTFKRRGIVFETVGSIDDNNTFECGSRADFNCQSSQKPINVQLRVNDTQAAACLINNCVINTNFVKLFTITYNLKLGHLILHIESMAITHATTTFTCEAESQQLNIKPGITVLPKIETSRMIVSVKNNSEDIEITVTTGCILLDRNLTFVWKKIEGKSNTTFDASYNQRTERNNTYCDPTLHCEGAGYSNTITFQEKDSGPEYYMECHVLVDKDNENARGNIRLRSNRTFKLKDTVRAGEINAALRIKTPISMALALFITFVLSSWI